MEIIACLKVKFILLTCCISMAYANAQVTLSTDFTSSTCKKEPLHNIWQVGNRISPVNGSNLRADLKLNLVRIIGGIKKRGKGKPQMDLDYDPCLYDSLKNEYIYNWEPLIDRLNKLLKSQNDIYQIVLDNPPWAFQYGYKFIPKGSCNSLHFREDERNGIYGNPLPPADKQAYHDFIKALITKLVDTYGKEKVLSWQFRVGSEIETPDHWRGTKQDFIEHFANTERAIRAILPDAIIGLHTREPGFLYKKGTVLNYKGEPYASFAHDLIEYCYDNNVRYDFWGISDYIIIGNKDKRQMSHKYEELFADLVNHPKWNKNAKLDLMEYSTITSMNKLGNGFINCVSSHKEVAEVILSHQFYKHKSDGLQYIYRWGNRKGSEDPASIAIINTMENKVRYETKTTGTPKIPNNELDALFAKGENADVFDVLAYNFNAETLIYQKDEVVNISFTTELPVGTTLNYRFVEYGKDQNELQNFLKNEPESGWIKEGLDRKGEPAEILKDEGMAAFKQFIHPNPYKFGEWHKIVTTKRMDEGKGSIVSISTSLPSFSFKKFEFKKQ